MTNNKQNIQPLFDRVLARLESEQQSSAGIYIPKEANERSQIMTIIAIGQVKHVKAGDKVIVAKYAGTEITSETEKLFIIKECDILCRFC